MNATKFASAASVDAASTVKMSPSIQLEQLAALGEKVGVFKDYDSQLDIPEISGLRTVKCLYRFKDESKRDKKNSYVRIPCSHLSEKSITERLNELMPFFVEYLQAEEDKIIKSLHSKGQLNVYPESLSLDKLIAFLEENSSSGRLTKEAIGNWFDEVLSSPLAEAFASKLGITLDENAPLDSLEKIEHIISNYKEKLESLASPKTVFREEDKIAIINMFNKLDESDSILDNSLAKRLLIRIQNMKEQNDILDTL